MKENAPRCDEILIFIIFVGRQRFRRDVFAVLIIDSLHRVIGGFIRALSRIHPSVHLSVYPLVSPSDSQLNKQSNKQSISKASKLYLRSDTWQLLNKCTCGPLSVTKPYD